MNKLDILFKSIILLHRENELGDITSDSSKSLVRTIITQMRKSSKPLLGGVTDMQDSLMDLCLDLVNNTNAFDKENLTQTLKIICKDNEKLINSFDNAINIDISGPGLKRSILNLRMHLNNYYREIETFNIIKKASYQLSLGKIEEGIQEFTNKLIINLEALNKNIKVKDKGIVDEIDVKDIEGLEKVFAKVKKQTNGDSRLKTGWKELNDLLNGGLRYGETVLLSALQHNFKSGMMRSIFAQLCMYNTPYVKETNKRALAVFVSFEDDIDIIFEFMYKYLKYAEIGEDVKIDNVDPKEISKYVMSNLTSTGFNVKILRVNPSDWTYKSLMDKTIEYEASGYEVKIMMVDYLSKLPTTGCDTSGPMGSAIRDMLTRLRDFYSARETLFITCHQMSVDAKQLIRNGIPAKDLVKEVANKGYYEGSKQLDQVVDLELYQHIAKIGKFHYLTIQRGKRRYPEIVPEELKYFMLPFPYKIPCIPPNIKTTGEYIGFKYSEIDSLGGLNMINAAPINITEKLFNNKKNNLDELEKILEI